MFVGVANAQLVEIPDSNFKNRLITLYPSCFINDSLDTQCNEIIQETTLNLNNFDVVDLTGLEYFINLEEFDCRNNELGTLTNLPASLKSIDVKNNLLTELPNLPGGLQHLNCDQNDLLVLPMLPSTLIGLNCESNNLTELPDPLSPNLVNLYCSHNQISSIPALTNTQLSQLFCSNNQLISLPEFPNTLSKLVCHYNQLESIPDLNHTEFSELNCTHNQLSALPDFPSSIEFVYASYNQLSSFPPINNFVIEKVYCDHNLLTEISGFHENLWVLDCSYNQLTELPQSAVGRNMLELNCEHNLLTELPSINNVNSHLVESLICNNNLLTTLPGLPDMMDMLNCDNNQIEVLPELPQDYLHTLSCRNNNLRCLPLLPDEMYGELNISGNEIVCLPNFPFYEPSIDINLPICTSNNTHDCNYQRLVTGTVGYDGNSNCNLELSEIGLRNRVVESTFGSYAITDSIGYYELFIDTGSHTINQQLPNNFWDIDCLGFPVQIPSSSTNDTVSQIDFPNQAETNCHWLQVEVASSNQIPCLNSNMYTINYCNYGTAEALGVYVDLDLPEEIIPTASTLPWLNLGDGVIRFQLGDLDIDECGTFILYDSVSCNAAIDWTVCVEAETFPLSPCFEGGSEWDNASIEVEGVCSGPNIEFTITNSGLADMSAPRNYRVYEDGQLLVADQSFQLASGQDLLIPVTATGKTYRLEADQVAGHPGVSRPRKSVERCGNSPHNLGLVNQASQDDADSHIDIECEVLIGPYDPNDKTVVPKGVGPEHYISLADTLFEYRIRFQNTGSAPAINVEIVDTLPVDFLNPLTFLSGVSSHPYSVRIYGPGIVVWRFENIMLPDSSADPEGSQGFVKFKINAYPNLPLGTRISNSAGIYFDYNPPIITNTSFVEFAEPQNVSVDGLLRKERIKLFPNPARKTAVLLLPEMLNDGIVCIYDQTGRKLLTTKVTDTKLILDLGAGFSNGLYLVSVFNEGVSIFTKPLSIIR